MFSILIINFEKSAVLKGTAFFMQKLVYYFETGMLSGNQQLTQQAWLGENTRPLLSPECLVLMTMTKRV
jgi:hypothetical protein